MFTGLVSDVGRVKAVEDRNGLRRITMMSGYPTSALQIGASVTHAGVCLTVVEFGERPVPGKANGSWWVVEAIPETLSRTVLGQWTAGARVNTELSLKAGDEMGGHIVSGHVDGLGQVIGVTPEGESRRIRIGLPANLERFVAEKGSIAIDGVSLTVAAVGGAADAPWFEVAIIPHTLEATTLGALAPGDKVNLEVDLLARYVARMLEVRDR
jgi:riboflavin synthase